MALTEQLLSITLNGVFIESLVIDDDAWSDEPFRESSEIVASSNSKSATILLNARAGTISFKFLRISPQFDFIVEGILNQNKGIAITYTVVATDIANKSFAYTGCYYKTRSITGRNAIIDISMTYTDVTLVNPS